MAVVAVLAAAAWGQPKVDPTVSVKSPGAGSEMAKADGTLAGIDLQEFWGITLRLEPGETMAQVVQLDENVYCLTSANHLFTLDANTGVTRWEAALGRPGQRVFRPIHARKVEFTEEGAAEKYRYDPNTLPMETFDAVMWNTASRVYVVNRATGKVVRNVELTFAASCGGATDGSYYYVGDVNGRLECVGLEAGATKWKMGTDGLVVAPVAVLGTAVLVADDQGSFRAIDPIGTGTLVWKKKLSGPITGAFHADARGFFIPCQDNRLYALATTGEPLWPSPLITGGPLHSDVQVGEKTVYQRAEKDKFYAVNLTDGQQRWTLDKGLEVLATINGTVYVRDTDGQLERVDEILGKVIGSASLKGLDVFAANVTVPGIWASTDRGHVVCLRPKAAGRVTAEMIRQAKQ